MLRPGTSSRDPLIGGSVLGMAARPAGMGCPCRAAGRPRRKGCECDRSLVWWSRELSPVVSVSGVVSRGGGESIYPGLDIAVAPSPGAGAFGS